VGPIQLSRYFLDISQGKFLNTPSVFEFPNDAAALREALKIWGDLARDIACELESHHDWRMSVEDEAGNIIFIIRTQVETIPR
jgi:hypothetical protein